MPWSYYAKDDINSARLLMSKHYSSAMMALFDSAVECNKRLIYPLACKKPLSSLLHMLSNNIVFYGGGANMKELLKIFDAFNIPFEYPIWDVNADKIADINGKKVIQPDFDTKVSNSVAIITIDKQEVSRSIAEKLLEIGFVVIKSKCRFLGFFIENFFE